MAKIKCVLLKPGEMPEKHEIENEYEAFRTAVDGYIEFMHIAPHVAFMVNEEGKLINLKPNFHWQSDVVFGTAVLFKMGEEGPEQATENEQDALFDLACNLKRANQFEKPEDYCKVRIISW